MLVRDLRWLLVMADQEQVTLAAAALGTSQPTVSRALARVEAEVGAQVFERAHDGLHVSPVGRLVVEAARDIVARHDRLLGELAGVLDPESGVVRLAFLDSIATSLVPGLLRSFREDSPAVRVVLTQEPGHEILDDLARGQVDLAITAARPSSPHGWHPLQDERLVLVVSPDHHLARRRRVRLAELASQELVTTPVGFGYRTLVEHLFHVAGVMPRVAVESQETATIEGLVAAGLGVAILPEQFAGQSGTVGIPLAVAGARRTIGLVWRTDRPLPPPAERLRTFVEATSVA